MAEGTSFNPEGSVPERYERVVAPLMAPFVTEAVSSLVPRPGESVLDLACGTGFVARSLRNAVGRTGRIVGADLNPGMLGVAAARSADGEPIEWCRAPADRLPFADDVFDAVVCQQGLQFFPDLAGAVREIARVCRPEGRLFATVWSHREQSPYFAAQYAAINRLAGTDEFPPFAHAIWDSPLGLVETLRAVGFAAVEAHEVILDVTLPPLADFAVDHLRCLPWSAALVEERPDASDVVLRTMSDLLVDHVLDDGSIRVPVRSFVVRGRR